MRRWLVALLCLPALAGAQLRPAGSNPGEEPPYMGAGLIGDPETFLSFKDPGAISLPGPIVFPTPPTPGIRSVVYFFAASDRAASPTNNNKIKRMVMRYRYRVKSMETGAFEASYRPSNNWNFTGVEMIKMYNCTFPADCTTSSRNDIDPALSGVQLAPEGPIAGVDPRAKPYIWIGLLPDLPAGSRIEVLFEAEDTADQIFLMNGGGNFQNRTFRPPGVAPWEEKRVRSNRFAGWRNSIDTAFAIPNTCSARNLDDPNNGTCFPYTGYWSQAFDAPAITAVDPWDTRLTQNVNTDATAKGIPGGSYIDARYQFPGGYDPDATPAMFYTGKRIHIHHNPIVHVTEVPKSRAREQKAKVREEFARQFEKAFGVRPRLDSKYQLDDEPCKEEDDSDPPAGGGGGGEGGGSVETEKVYTWYYPCNSAPGEIPGDSGDCNGRGCFYGGVSAITDPNTNDWYTDVGGRPMAPPLKENGGPRQNTRPCTQDTSHPFRKWLNTLDADTRQRIILGFAGEHDTPTRSYPFRVTALENPKGLDLRSGFLAMTQNENKFLIKFTAENLPDQDFDFGLNLGEFINIGWGLLNGKTWYVNLWVVRIVNPDGDDGYLLYLPLLFSFLRQTTVGQIVSGIESLSCELKKYAITNAKAHILGNLADLLSQDPTVMAPVQTEPGTGNQSDPNARAIWFTLDRTAANWLTFIGQKNPSKYHAVNMMTMVMPIRLGQDPNEGIALPDFEEFDVTRLLSLPINVDSSTYVNYYYRPMITYDAQQDSVAPNAADASYGINLSTVQATNLDASGKWDYTNSRLKIDWAYKDATGRFKNTDGTWIDTRVGNNKEAGYKIDFDPSGQLTGQPKGGFKLYRRYCGLRTKLSSDAGAGANTISVANATGFAAGHTIIVGFGSATPEIKIVDAKSGNTLTLKSALANPQTAGSAVVMTDPNQTDPTQPCTCGTLQCPWSAWRDLTFDTSGNWAWMYTFWNDPALGGTAPYRSPDQDPSYFAGLSCGYTGDTRPHRGKNRMSDLLNANVTAPSLWYQFGFRPTQSDPWTQREWRRTTTTFSTTGFSFSFEDKSVASPPVGCTKETDWLCNPDYNLIAGYRYQYKVTAADWPNPFGAYKNELKQAGWGGFSTVQHSDADGGVEKLQPPYYTDLLEDATKTCSTAGVPKREAVWSGTTSSQGMVIPQDPPFNEGPGVLSNVVLVPVQSAGGPAPSRQGDLNADGEINLKDFFVLARAYGSTPQDGNWNQNADLNDDSVVDLTDFAILAKQYSYVRGRK